MLDGGEHDAALKHAADALAVACRYGHSLHKISLRIQIGDILIQRGDPKSGQELIRIALKLAARIGYQRVVERAQRALQDIPGTGVAGKIGGRRGRGAPLADGQA